MGENGTGGSAKQRKSDRALYLVSLLNAPLYSVPMAKPIPPEDVARTILFLASERYSGSVHGQLIPIDAGKMGNLIWTREELDQR